MHLKVEVAKLFSRTGELIQIDADAARFDEAVAREVQRSTGSTKARPRLTPVLEGEAKAAQGEVSATPARAVSSARSTIRREVAKDGALRFSNDRCAYVILKAPARRGAADDHRPRRRRVREGSARRGPAEIARFGPLTLFINLREVTAAGASVSEVWTAFFAGGAQRLKRVRILVGSRLIQLTVALSKEVSRTGQLIQIDTDLEAFEEALARETSGAAPPSTF